MASNNVYEQQLSRGSSEAPSLGQVEGSLFYQSPLQGQSEDSLSGAESTVNTLEQMNLWAPLDNFKASFSNHLGHRLLQLFEEGTLKLSPHSIIWIDENGLPTRVGLSSQGREDLNRPSPLYFAGENAEITVLDDSIRRGRALWRQPVSEKDYSPENETTTSSLFDLVFAELKSMPRITHWVWKMMLTHFEKFSKAATPYPDGWTAPLVKGAIEREREDFLTLARFGNAFQNPYSLKGWDLAISCQSIHSLAGVHPKEQDGYAALEILDDELGSHLSDVMGLATLIQLDNVSPTRPAKGAERLAKLTSVLRAGEMESLMRKHFVAKQRSIDF